MTTLVPQVAFLELSLHADTSVGRLAAAHSLVNCIAMSIAVVVLAAHALARIGGKIATVCLSLVLTTSLITVVIKLMGLSMFPSPASLLSQMPQ